MPLFTPAQRRLATHIAQLGHANPFLPRRIELEQAILEDAFIPGEPVWSVQDVRGAESKNLDLLSRATRQLADEARDRIAAGERITSSDAELYADVALYCLFDRFRLKLHEVIEAAHQGEASTSVPFWEQFRQTADEYFAPGGNCLAVDYDRAHMLACFFQLRRAFFHVFYFIVGRSPAAARLRAAVWQSIFTHDLKRYQRSLYRHLGDVTTLITGPSGTGKELVARAIGLSRYTSFDPKQEAFAESFASGFHPINLSALSPTLIESELFGHRRGAFTGALESRVGWLEMCPEQGVVFLDEIGELDTAIQVKLLRVLQTRTFQRLGETSDRRFQGKVLAATNRDLVTEIQSGRFREDFYYRLCADHIETPSLREQLDECPDDIERLLLFIARRVTPAEADCLAAEVAAWINSHMNPYYAWPGNVRELEQCFRNVMIHGEYRPAAAPTAPDDDSWQSTVVAMEAGELTADQLVRQYCQLIYNRCGSYEQTAKRLGLDRRTVKKKLEQ